MKREGGSENEREGRKKRGGRGRRKSRKGKKRRRTGLRMNDADEDTKGI